MSLPHAGDTEEGAGRAGLTEEVPRERNLESGTSLQARNLWEQLGSLAFGVGGVWQIVPEMPERTVQRSAG